MTSNGRNSAALSQDDLSCLAMENTVSYRSVYDAPGEMVDDLLTLSPGQLVYVPKWGRAFSGVVISVSTTKGVTRALVRFATQRAVTDAHWEMSRFSAGANRPEEYIAERCRGMDLGNTWDLILAEADLDPGSELYDGMDPADVERRVEAARDEVQAIKARMVEQEKVNRAKVIEEIKATVEAIRTSGVMHFVSFEEVEVTAGRLKLASDL